MPPVKTLMPKWPEPKIYCLIWKKEFAEVTDDKDFGMQSVLETITTWDFEREELFLLGQQNTQE